MIMKKRQLFIALAIIAIFAVSSALAKMLESAPPRLSTKQQRLNKIQARVNTLDKKLSLNESQRKQITEILSRVKDKTVEILEEVSLKISKLKEDGEVEIEGALTQIQKDKFNNVYEKEGEDEDIVKVLKSSY
jgi:carbonic anhydrase